jgi:hypothetical protein
MSLCLVTNPVGLLPSQLLLFRFPVSLHMVVYLVSLLPDQSLLFSFPASLHFVAYLVALPDQLLLFTRLLLQEFATTTLTISVSSAFCFQSTFRRYWSHLYFSILAKYAKLATIK